MKLYILLFCSLLGFTACQRENIIEDLVAEKSITNASYGSDPAQKMDIYLPADRDTSTTNVLVLIHGGAWIEGDKADFTAYMETLKQRLPGYAIFNINYRLAANNLNQFPAQEADVKKAFEYIHNRTREYKVSKNLAVLGASAGGHLALLQAFKYPEIPVRAVVDLFGPADLTAMYNQAGNPFVKPLLEAVTGGTPQSRPAVYQQSSPVNFITNQSPPTLILQGGLDVLVDPSQSTLLKSRLEAAGVPVQYVFYPTEGHGWTGPNLEDSFNKIEAFLKSHMP